MSMTMDATKTVIKDVEYYQLADAARLVGMTGTGLKVRLIRLGMDVDTKLPGSNRVYVRVEDINTLLGK